MSRRTPLPESPAHWRARLDRNATNMRAWNARNKPRVAMDRRARKFGVSVESLIALLAAQGNVCALCKAALSFDNKDTHVDHSHATGKVRGVLCNRCNLMIGHSRESVDILAAAIEYLRMQA